ncbi:hypothetical protein C4565_03400 [Candidatus Parcubacteria bacterium]|jgi:hypothetical protein|nr:MAG: hypothetical protein C4565_03400 [Candidatus Parcubacteria bacterium]
MCSSVPTTASFTPKTKKGSNPLFPKDLALHIDGAEGETRTRTTVGYYPLKIEYYLKYQIIIFLSRIFGRSD